MTDALGKMPSHTSMADLEMMAEAMQMLEGNAAAFFAYEIVANKLFVAEDRQLRLMIDIALDKGALADALSAMFEVVPGSAEQLIENASNHMLHGTSRDPKAVGGWNADELETAYASLLVARDGLTIPFGANRN